MRMTMMILEILAILDRQRIRLRSLEAAAGSDWEPLRFDSHPSRQRLETQIEEVLGPLWSNDDLGEALTDEDVREVGGLAQILVTPDR